MFFNNKVEQTKGQKVLKQLFLVSKNLGLVFYLARLKTLFLNALNFYNVPRFACSLSIDSNKALKLPAPKPRAPIR